MARPISFPTFDRGLEPDTLGGSVRTSTTKSFSQFLHENGMIDGAQLRSVLEQERDVALGLLTEPEVDDLDALLHGRHALMSRLLLANGYVDRAELMEAAREYAEESKARTLQLKLKLEHARCPQIAEVSTSILQQLYERVMGSPLELGISGSWLPRWGGDRVWSQALHVDGQSYKLAMQMTDDDALSLATVVLGIELDEFDELAEDAVSEFLNIVIGHICGNLGAPGGVRADPPEVTPAEEFSMDSAEAVVLECDGDDIVFHFALP